MLLWSLSFIVRFADFFICIMLSFPSCSRDFSLHPYLFQLTSPFPASTFPYLFHEIRTSWRFSHGNPHVSMISPVVTEDFPWHLPWPCGQAAPRLGLRDTSSNGTGLAPPGRLGSPWRQGRFSVWGIVVMGWWWMMWRFPKNGFSLVDDLITI